MQKTLFRGSSYKIPKVKNYFLVNMYFIYRYSKIKNRVTRLFFKLEAFNCKVSFYRLTLTTVIVILRLKFEVKRLIVKVNLKRLAIRDLSRLLNN